MGKFPIVVGLPTLNVEETIVHVLNNVVMGLKHYLSERALIVVADGGSTDNTIKIAEMYPLPKDIKLFILEEEEPLGKGSAVKSIFEAGIEVGAKSISLVDADIVSISPEWMPMLIKPIIYGRAHFVAPYYHRYKYDGMITNLLAYPFTKALYGGNRRQPLGGEISISREFASLLLQKDVPHDWGIDIFITTNALANDVAVSEAILGRKIHGSVRHYLEPSKHLKPMFMQVASQMFGLAKEFGSVWMNRETSDDLKKHRYTVKGYAEGLPPIPIRISEKNILREYREGALKYKDLIKNIEDEWKMEEGALSNISEGIDEDAWAKCVFSACINPSKNMIDLLFSLWHGRFYNYIAKTRELSNADAEKYIDMQLRAFVKNKKRFSSMFSRMQEVQK